VVLTARVATRPRPPKNQGVAIRLAEAEARILEAFARRQLTWDVGQPAHVVSASQALGVFTAPPLGVLVFLAIPTAEPIGDPVDVVVPLASLADAVRDLGTSGMDLNALPRATVTPGASPSVLHLPPTEGWQMPIHGLSGDLIPVIDQASEEFAQRSAGLPPRSQEVIANEIWDRPAFAGLPLRVLHAAHRLGMISNDRAKVSAAACGPWKRFSTPRGQIFVYQHGPAARLSLHVVR